MSTENKGNEGQGNNEEKLYAGKFKTVEELEAGYKNSLPTFQENETLKKKVEELSTVPHDYVNPNDLNLDEKKLADLKERAKEAGLTQAQYEKFVRNEKARVENYTSTFEKAKKEVGEEQLNILKDYVAKNYPKELQENMVNTFIVNKEARKAALDHRQQLLNNQVPGTNRVAAGGYTVTKEDVRKAYDAKTKNPHDMAARDHYIKLNGLYAEQKTG